MFGPQSMPSMTPPTAPAPAPAPTGMGMPALPAQLTGTRGGAPAPVGAINASGDSGSGGMGQKIAQMIPQMAQAFASSGG
jgi:hypothetical protein